VALEGHFDFLPNTPLNSGDNHRPGCRDCRPGDHPPEWPSRCGIAARHDKRMPEVGPVSSRLLAGSGMFVRYHHRTYEVGQLCPMAWQYPFITIDQNQLRNPDAIARVLDDCCRNGLRPLLPDGAFLEFAKGGCPLDTARRSFEILAPHRELVCSSRKIMEMMRDELQPTSSMHHGGPGRFDGVLAVDPGGVRACRPNHAA
jgi:hypothetical protein